MMKNRQTKKLLSMAMLMLGGLSTVQAATLTVKVKDSQGNPLDSVGVQWVQSGYNKLGTGNGLTDNNGELTGDIPDNVNYRLRLTYRGTSYETSTPNNSGFTTKVECFKTSQVKVAAQSGGIGAAGIGISYMTGYPTGSWVQAGGTDSKGELFFEVFPFDNMNIRATANGTYETHKIEDFDYGTPQGSPEPFDNLVKLQSPNTSFLISSSWQPGNIGRFVFPGTYTVNVNGTYRTSVTLTGGTFNKVPCVILVKDHNNNPTKGAALRGGYGNIAIGGAFAWHGPATDVNGCAIDWVHPGYKYCSYEARVNGTTAALAKDVTVNNGNVFSFKTSELTLKLQDCAGNGIANGSARYGIGTNYSAWFVPGANRTNANGITCMEAFPGTYSFEMGINQSTEVKQIVFTGTNGLTWTTTNVAINWPYSVAYGGNGGSAWFPNKAGTQMLPGTWNFRFDGPNGQTFAPVTVAGCSTTKSPVVFRLLTSTGAPIEGGKPEYGVNEWHTMPSTNAEGNSIVMLDGNLGSTYCSMFFRDGRQVVVQDLAASPIVTFRTKLVTIDFRNSGNNNDANQIGENLQFGVNKFQQFGAGATTNGKATMELLPLSYYFQLSYKGGTQTLVQDVAQNQTVLFQTVPVTIDFRNSNNQNDVNLVGENLQFGINGYQQFGTGTTSDVAPNGDVTNDGKATMELLPLSYYFQLSYKGGTQTLVKNVAQDHIVSFNTTKVTMKLNGAATGTEGTNLQFGINGYQTFATGNTSNGQASMELLPLSYYFSLNYGASNLVKVQDVSLNPVVDYFINAGGSAMRMGASSNSLEAAASIAQVSFYPNPAVNSLHISMPAAGTVAIFSVDGRKLAQHTVVAGTTSIDVTLLPAGNHVMIVNYNGNTETHKFVKL